MAEYIKKSDVLAYPIWRDNYDKVNGNAHFINGVESVIEYVEGLPAADVAEVRHGYWDDSLDGLTPYCSVCRCTHRCLIRRPIYCPNCGARMDKEAEYEAD